MEEVENRDINIAHLKGEAGERIKVSRDRLRPSSFSLKTVRFIVSTDGDRLGKFDWHTIVCMDHTIVSRIKEGMIVEVEGAISTTRAKSAIIASRIVVQELNIDWSTGSGPKLERS